MTTQHPQHKFALEQTLEVQDDKYPATVRVVALLPASAGVCTQHGAPYYGCVHSGDHFTLCEGILKPLSSTAKRKMN